MPLKELKSNSVALLMPCGGPVEPRVLQSAINLATTAQINGITVRQVGVTDRTLIHTARNMLAAGFLATDCEWSFWMDSDMILEARTLPVMLSWAKRLKATMATGIYYQRMNEHKPILWRSEVASEDGQIIHPKRDDDFAYTVYSIDDKTPFCVDYAGFGCSLIHRSVFEDMKGPYYFRFKFIDRPDGSVGEMSEDFFFFSNAKKLGHKLWAIPELECGHLGKAPIITQADMKAKLDMSKMVKMNMEVARK